MYFFLGIGFNPSDLDKEWTTQQDGFNELLQQLQSGEEKASLDNTGEADLSGKSLELKSKTSKARVQ